MTVRRVEWRRYDPAMRVRMLGGFEVSGADSRVETLTPKQRLVLAVLLLELDRVVSASSLVDALWGDESDGGVSTLHSYVSRLRSVLEPDRAPRVAATVLVTQAPGYRLRIPRADVDMCRFEDAAAQGRARFREGDHRGACTALRQALDMWTGPLLPELAHEPFVIPHATRLEGVRLSTLEAAADSHLHLGEHFEATTLIENEAREHPTRERLQFLLALGLYRAERQADALRVIDRCRRALLEQSGLSLSSELQHLETAILDHDPWLEWRRPVNADHPSSAAWVHPDAIDAPPDVLGDDTASSTPDGVQRRAIVGRASELHVLDGAVAATLDGRGTIATILGEPDIGKTRLAEAVVERAAERGMAVAWARCAENRAAPPFWPLTQLGDQLRAAGFTDLQVRELDRRGAETAVSERFQLYRAVLDAVAAIDRPVLFVIDDLQWADPDSLRLIEHIASDLRSTGTLLIATARPIDDDTQSAFVDCLAEIARAADSIQIVLGALDATDVTEWIAARHEVSAPREIADLVHERTGGNALFVKEVIELLAAEGRLGQVESAREARAIPPGVKSVVRRRVSRLPQPTQAILPVAAVLGRTLDVGALTAALSSDTASVLDALEPALTTGVLVEADGGLVFSHAVVADALADEVNAVRRATINAAAARALTSAAGADFGVLAAKIAHHAFEGMMAGTGELAIEAGTRAAELASDQLAHEDAAAHWSRVADAISRCRPADLRARIEALIAQASALLRADMVVAAKTPVLAAIDTAAVAGLADQMARAALLVNHEHVWANEPYGIVDTELVRRIERTIAHVGDDAPQRALLLGALAAELAFADPDVHLSVCAAAVDAARRTADPTTMAKVLNAVSVPCRPTQLEQRRTWACEVIELAQHHELAPDQRFAAHYHLAETFVEMGEFAAADVELATARRLIESVPSDRLRCQLLGFESALALARGRHAEAERTMNAAYELHRRGRRYDAEALMLANLMALRLDRGGLDDLIPLALTTAVESAYGRTVAETFAFAMLELGRADLAATLVESFDASSEFPNDYMSLCCMTAALHVRVELGHRDAAASIAGKLAPFGNRWASAGTTPSSMGPTKLALARELALRGETSQAAAAFADAVGLIESNDAFPWLARALVHQARFLHDTDDGAGAAVAVERAARLAERFGLIYVERRLDQLVS